MVIAMANNFLQWNKSTVNNDLSLDVPLSEDNIKQYRLCLIYEVILKCK